MSLWPFFTYYGGKWRIAKRYPPPQYKTIIEPFAGAAGYSLRYPDRKIILVENNPKLAALWRYLISASPQTIRSLPLIAHDGTQTVAELNVSPVEETLIGFWLNKGTVAPSKSPSAWMREGLRPKSFWGKEIRERIARQVPFISHWRIVEGDYTEIANVEATWFIDPPYEKAGSLYVKSSAELNFTALSNWCRSRLGQTLVCENVGATWLPFTPFTVSKSLGGKHGKNKSQEAIWKQLICCEALDLV